MKGFTNNSNTDANQASNSKKVVPPKALAQKTRAALAQALTGQATKGSLNGKGGNGQTPTKQTDEEKLINIRLEDPARKVLKETIGAIGQHSVNGRDGARLSISMDHDHEEHSTHEDRKTSTSSDAQFSEPVGYASGSVNDLDHHNALGKQSPHLINLMECKPLFANGAVGGPILTANNPEKNHDHHQIYDNTNGAGNQIPSQLGQDNPNQIGSSCSSTHGGNSQQIHPFNVLIAEFQQKRQITNAAAANGSNPIRKQGSVFEFYGLLQKQIRDLETQYTVYKKQKRLEQLQNQGSSQNQFGNFGSSNIALQSEAERAAILMEDCQQKQQPLNISSLNHDNAPSSTRKASVAKASVENDENSSELANSGGNNQNVNFYGSYNGGQQPIQHFEPFSSFDFQPNLLQFFYPKQVQRQLHKKKYSHSERIIHGLKPPVNAKTQGGVSKHAVKLRTLADCQMSLMKVILQRIDRKSRPIRKQERQVHENLRRRRVNLDDDNPFDILQLIQSSYSNKASQLQLNTQTFLPMGQLSEYKASVSFQEPQANSFITSSAQKMTPQTKVNSKIYESLYENPEDPNEHIMEPPKPLDKQSISKIETSTAKKNNSKSAVKIIEQAESSFTESKHEKIEITPKTTGKSGEDFKTAAKKVSLNSKTASKPNMNGELNTPSTSVMKKLALKKSQSVALPLIANDQEDTPMKDEQINNELQHANQAVDLNSMVNDLDINPSTPQDGGNKSSKRSQRKPIGGKTFTLPKEQPETQNNDSQLIEAFNNDKGSLTFKIKIPGSSIQLPSTQLGPQNLQKSKSYTPSTKAQVSQKKKQLGASRRTTFDEVGENDNQEQPSSIAHNMQFDQEDQIQNLNLPLENYEEDCICECMLQHQQQQSHGNKYHSNQGLPLQQINPLPNSTSYYIYNNDVEDNGICQACCNSGEDVLHVPEIPKFGQSHSSILHPHQNFYHSNIHSQDPSPRHELGNLNGALHRQYSVPANQLHVGMVETSLSIMPQDDGNNEHSLYYDHFISQNGFKNDLLHNNYSQPRTAPSTNLNSGVRAQIEDHQMEHHLKNHCARTIDFYDFGLGHHENANNQNGFNANNILGQSQTFNFNDFNNSGLDSMGPHRGEILPDLPSVGKDMHKMHPPSFFHQLDSGAAGVSNRMVLGSNGNAGQNNSPDPQGTTINRHFNHPMMMIDSATPMFTSEFTIMPPPSMMVGGIDTALGAPHLIQEWNPLADQNGAGGVLQAQTPRMQQNEQNNTSADHLHRHESSFY